MVMGERAADHCDDFGWRPVGRIDPSLVAETTQQPRYGAGRAWSNASSYTLAEAPRRIYLVYTTEGAFDFTADGETVIAGAGQMVLLDGEAPTAARTLAKTARFVWYFEPRVLRPESARFRFHEPIEMNHAVMTPLLAASNAVIADGSPRSASAREHVGAALESLVAGALDEAGTLRTGRDGLHADGLFMAAQLAIDERFRDPAFDASALARELSISVRTLESAFSTFGSTPAHEIRRRRTSEVDRLTALQMTTAEIFEHAGFAAPPHADARQRESPTRRDG